MKSLRSLIFVIQIYFLLFELKFSIVTEKNSIHLSDESKLILERILFEQFQNSILFNENVSDTTESSNSNDFSNNIKKFQTNLIRNRNAKCLYEKHQRFDWSLIKFEDFNTSIVQAKSNDLTNRILYELNNKVYLFIAIVFK